MANKNGKALARQRRYYIMDVISREFQVFVKPVGPVCNLSCTYCYYLDKKDLYPSTRIFLMADNVLERYVVQQIEASTESVINFSWHGGEPLMAGKEFFRKVIALQEKHRPAGATILNGIQTNGTLLDDEWCKFLGAEGFIIGLSMDGPPGLHDFHRRTHDDSGTSEIVLKGYELLKKHGIIAEILCVVNSDNVSHPVEIYDFFKQLGAKFMTFLPLVEQDHSLPGGVSSATVPADKFGYFLTKVFDEWVAKDIGDIKVQVFEEVARTAFSQDHTLCIFKKDCGGVPVVEHNGDFFCCDHYVDHTHLLGNIKDHSLEYFLDHEAQRAFGKAKSLTLPQYCINCEVRAMCNGECPKNRFINTPDGEPGLNYLCAGYRYFFNHCRPFVEAIREAWKNQAGQ
jgi:uncharacterized protein